MAEPIKRRSKTIQCFFSLEVMPKPDDIADALAVALAGINKLNDSKQNIKMTKNFFPYWININHCLCFCWFVCIFPCPGIT